jgi:uncharacterized protein (TIGR02147 family)
MKAESKAPDVMKYKDFRQYLLDFLSLQKELFSWYSVRYFAEKIGMDHANVVRVLQGKRGLPEKSLQACTEVLKLKGRRAEYFRLLVLYQKARNPDKAAQLLERLLSLSGSSQMKLEAGQFEFYRCWYHTAIYHLLGEFDVADDYAMLARMLTPPIQTAQAEKSVALLLEIGLLERDYSNRIVQSTNALTTGEEWKSTTVHNFQKTTLEMALNSLTRHPREQRDFSTLTMGISSKDIPRIKDVLKNARKAIIEIAQESEPVDSVYHLNFQLFPMAFTEKKKL